MATEKVKAAARALSKLGAARGGAARAAKLSAEERSDIARQAAAARWGATATGPLPVATYGSPDRPLRIGEIEIPCYVLSDSRRVLSQRGLQGGMGFSAGGARGGARRLAHFLRVLEGKGLDLAGLTVRVEEPIEFVPQHGGRPALGYEATILPDVCRAVLEARRLDILHPQQGHIAKRCEILLGGLADVGIIALVDEATGYQDARAHDALAKILEQFIAKELRKWVKTFPTDFYKEMFRLRGLPYTGSPKRPGFIGGITNDLVYLRLAPGVLEELHRKNPSDGHGRRKHRHHQWLTDEIGDPRLREHLSGLTALMKAEDSWDVFYRKVDRVYPRFDRTLPLPLRFREDSKIEKGSGPHVD